MSPLQQTELLLWGFRELLGFLLIPMLSHNSAKSALNLPPSSNPISFGLGCLATQHSWNDFCTVAAKWRRLCAVRRSWHQDVCRTRGGAFCLTKDFEKHTGLEHELKGFNDFVEAADTTVMAEENLQWGTARGCREKHCRQQRPEGVTSRPQQTSVMIQWKNRTSTYCFEAAAL